MFSRLIALPVIALTVLIATLSFAASVVGAGISTGWTFTYITRDPAGEGVMIWLADFERGLSVPERVIPDVFGVTHLSPDRRFAIIQDFDADLTIYDLQTQRTHSLHIPARLRPELRDIRWGPDSRQLTYTSDTAYVATIRETTNGLLFDTESYGNRNTSTWGSLRWANDGRRIAYIRGNGASGPDVFVAEVAADGAFNGHRAISDDAPAMTERTPVWSNDGQGLAFARFEDMRITLYAVMPVDGEAEPRKLTGGINRLRAIRWSPDDSRLAFLGAPEGLVDDLYIVDLAGRYDAPLQDRVGVLNSQSLTWTPDGTHIIFNARAHGDEIAHIYVLNVQTRVLSRWTSPGRPGRLLD